jgi:transglutaminase-like putative cysteine protease
VSTLSGRFGGEGGENRLASLADRLGVDPVRVLAVTGVAVVLLAPLSVLWFVSNVAGEPAVFAAIVVASVLGAVVVARYLSVVPAFLLAAGLLVGGGALYVLTLPGGFDVVAQGESVVEDSISLLTGLSVIRIVNAGVWAQAAAPAPTFLTVYLALRRRYVSAVAVAGLTLSVFVLTGDANVPTVLFGVLGGAAAVGLGDAEHRGGGLRAAEAVAIVLAVVVVVSLTLSVVPAVAGTVTGGGGSSPLLGGESDDGTVEASLISAGSNIGILGSIELSPEVRFTVTSERESYWRVGSYDRFTGSGWVRTGPSRPYDGALQTPPGSSRTVVQTVRAEGPLDVMPAAWKPRRVRASDVPVSVTSAGGLEPAQSLSAGETFTVESRVVVASPGELRTAGTDYPDGLQERYTQLPANQPERVAERTARITANAQNPYDTARVVEQWLENNREYSLSVERPSGNIADAFLFDMEAGYCTYYATTMVSMLRTQDIPARLVVGYTPGQQVAEDRWVARGLDSHAWVEVYFPDVGWVRFDPTPAAPREAAEQSRIDTARDEGEQSVDVPDTQNESLTPTPTPPSFESADDVRNGNVTVQTATPDIRQRQLQDAANGTAVPVGSDGGGFSLPDLTREQMGFGAIVLFGAAVAVRRSGLTGRAYREVWLRYQPRTDPTRDVERAYERLVYLLEREGPSRQPGQTPREFLAGVTDERASRVLELYERSHYAGEVSEATADEAVDLVDDIVAERPTLR